MTGGRFVPGILILGAAFMLSAVTYADDLRPLYVETRLLEGGLFEARIKRPPQVPASVALNLELSAPCTRVPEGAGTAMAAPVLLYRCEGGAGGRIARLNPTADSIAIPTIVRHVSADGETSFITLAADVHEWQIPAASDGGSSLLEYASFGVQHILVGFDHLLFLVCLIWVAGSASRVVLTVTGFTLAHSVTLALAVVGVLRVPVAWVESIIALSVLFLAVEVIKGPGARESLAWRYPVVVSGLFGLVHGLGFAVVLQEVGLPKDELLVGLVGFNVGVEAGQVIFIFILLTFLWSVRRIFASGAVVVPRVRQWSGYSVGTLSAMWLVDRVIAFAV